MSFIKNQTESSTGSRPDKIEQAKNLLSAIYDKWQDDEEFTKLEALLEQAKKENYGKMQELSDLLKNAIENGAGSDQMQLERLKTNFEKDFKGINNKKAENKAGIIARTEEKTAEVRAVLETKTSSVPESVKKDDKTKTIQSASIIDSQVVAPIVSISVKESHKLEGFLEALKGNPNKPETISKIITLLEQAKKATPNEQSVIINLLEKDLLFQKEPLRSIVGKYKMRYAEISATKNLSLPTLLTTISLKKSAMSSEESRQISAILEQADTEKSEEEQKQLIASLRETSEKLPSSSPNKVALQNLADNYEKKYAETKKIREKKSKISESVKSKVIQSKEKIDEKNHLDLLANLDNDKDIENDNHGFVSEQELKRSLLHASEGGKTIDTVYERITGEKPDWTSEKTTETTVKKFHESLRMVVALVQQVTSGGNAGLDMILRGKTVEFISAVKAQMAKNGNKPLEVKIDGTESNGLSPAIYNTLGAAGTIGVALATSGLIVVGTEKYTVEEKALMEKVEADKKGGFLNKSGKVLNWIKEAFMGRKLSLTLGRKRVADFTDDVYQYTEKVMNLTKDTKADDIKYSELKSHFLFVQKTAKDAGIILETEDIQKILIKSYILNKGTENEGSNWSASIGLLMLIGVHRDSISVYTQKTENSEHNEIERKITYGNIDPASYEKIGIKIEEKEGKYLYVVPSEIQMEHDYKKYSVISEQQRDLVTGNYVFEKPQDIHFSYIGGKYKLSFIPLIDKKSAVVEGTTENIELRERAEDLASKPFAEKLFFIGHNKEFKEFVGKLARQDFEGAREWLTRMSKKGKYRTLARMILTEKTPMETWSSYMYGSKESRSKQAYTQQYADEKVRKPATIRAEGRLADTLGIKLSPEREEQFRIKTGEKFTPTQVSKMYTGQEMTIACFATPTDSETHKKGSHRLDTYDGSVNVINKTVLITDPTEKESIIKAILANTSEKRAIHNQLNKLNTLIKENGGKEIVTLENYIAYLATSDITKLGVSGLKLQAGKEPKVFEGRAMIAGNVCLNRLYGITYPAFGSQKIAPVASMDTSVPFNTDTVETRVLAGGLNTLGAIAAAQAANQPAANPATSSAPSGGTGGGANGGGVK